MSCYDDFGIDVGTDFVMIVFFCAMISLNDNANVDKIVYMCCNDFGHEFGNMLV